MANTTPIIHKRTSVSGRLPSLDQANTRYINPGELSINLTDQKVVTSNGSVLFEVGANLTNLSVETITANGTIGVANQVLRSNGTNAYWDYFTGFAGSQGVIGFTGSQGIVGFIGSQGIIGFTGSKGDIGFTGSRGTVTPSDTAPASPIPNLIWYDSTTGKSYFWYDDGSSQQWILFADPTVTDGIDGYTGSAGTNGFTGSAGTNGFTGSRGFTGSQGSFGYTGSAGTNGFTGSAGTNGFTGSAGTNGFTGSQGAGFTGSQGDIGFTGSKGDIGFTGSQGAGFTGSAGSQGFTGSQGDIGYTGSQGYTGSRGDIGYTGSIGFTGSKGDIGYTGSFGYTGSQGTTYIGSTAPSSPTNGDTWWDSDDGIRYVYYDDGTSQQWVQESAVGPIGYTGSAGRLTVPIAFFFTSTPTAAELLMMYTAVESFAFANNFSGSAGNVGTNPTSSFVLTVQKNSANVGNVTISTGGSFTFDSGNSIVSIVSGDQLRILAPTVADATVQNVSLTLKGSI